MSADRALVSEVRRYNAWRRGDESQEMPEPKRIGEALDALCDRVEELEEVVRAARHATLQPPESETPSS